MIIIFVSSLSHLCLIFEKLAILTRSLTPLSVAV